MTGLIFTGIEGSFEETCKISLTVEVPEPRTTDLEPVEIVPLAADSSTVLAEESAEGDLAR